MKADLIYWDSDAFLGALQEEPGKRDRCDGTIARAKAGEVLIVTSTLTIAEVLWLRNAPRIPHDKAAILRRFFRHTYFRFRNVTRTVSESAQDLVWFHSIKPKDAIHVATALDAGIPTLETFDDDLLKKSGKIGTTSLEIRMPLPVDQQVLFPDSETRVDGNPELGFTLT